MQEKAVVYQDQVDVHQKCLNSGSVVTVEFSKKGMVSSGRISIRRQFE